MSLEPQVCYCTTEDGVRILREFKNGGAWEFE
jgi:hypothetical protein